MSISPSELDGPDNGAAQRIRRRLQRSAVIPLAAAVVLIIVGWVWPVALESTASYIIGSVVIAALVGVSAVLTYRAQLWSRATDRIMQWTQRDTAKPVGWVRGVCAKPEPLRRAASSGITLLSKGRKYPAHMLAVRTVTGPLANGAAVLLHARTDGIVPETNDDLTVYCVSPRGPFLLGRDDDGSLFLADRWIFSAL